MKTITKAQEKHNKRIEAIASLKRIMENTTVYTTCQHVSRSGMVRHIKCYIANINDRTKEAQTVNITWYVARILDYKINQENGGLVVGGCGMDMGYHVVYSLSRALYPNGFYPQDHGQKYGRNGTSAEELDTDGGYALDHQWL